MGVINCLPAGVITIFTSAPFFISKRANDADLYAAILQEIPKTICFPCIDMPIFFEYANIIKLVVFYCFSIIFRFHSNYREITKLKVKHY